MPVLKLGGGAALSGFRLDKLNQLIAEVDARTSVHSAQFWHFVEVTREPDARERDVLSRLLTYGPPAAAPGNWSAEVLVAPRLGTISPWSSKATDISRQCGLGELVRRIERGTAVHLVGDSGDAGAALSARTRALIRRTETKTGRYRPDLSYAPGR